MKDNLKSKQNTLKILVKQYIFGEVTVLNMHIFRKLKSIPDIFQLIYIHCTNNSYTSDGKTATLDFKVYYAFQGI